MYYSGGAYRQNRFVYSDVWVEKWKKTVVPGLTAKEAGFEVPKHKRLELLENWIK